MSDTKHPVILLLNGFKQEAKIVREFPKGSVVKDAPAPKKTPKKSVLKSIAVEFAANGGYAVTLRYMGSRETMLLLCKNKADLFETLEFVTPNHEFNRQG